MSDNELIAEWGYTVLETGVILGKNGKPLKLYPGTSGYVQVNVYNKGERFTLLVHRLVCEKYNANPLKRHEVNHDDGNKLNNHKDNLYWVTRAKNIQHGFDTGLITPPWKGKSGAKHNRSKAVYQCRGDKVISEYGSVREAAKSLGIFHNLIYDNLKGKLKSAGGFQWKYK